MRPLRLLVPHLRMHGVRLVVAVACLLASAATGMAFPWILRDAIDVLSGDRAGASLAVSAFLLVGATAVGALFRYGARATLLTVNRRIEYAMRNDLYAHLTRVPVRDQGTLRVGDLMTRLTRDVSTACSLLEVAWYATQVVTAAGAFVLMAVISPSLLAVVVLPLAVIPFVIHRQGGRLDAILASAAQQFAAVTSLIQENLVTVRLIRAYGLEAHAVRRFDAAHDDYDGLSRRVSEAYASTNLILQGLTGLGAALVLAVGGRQVISGAIGVGELVAFSGYAAMLHMPLQGLGGVMNHLARSRASLARIRTVLDLPAVAEPETTPAAPPLTGAIELRDLSFAYDTHQVLRHVSLRLAAGTTVAIVGPNGAGKSTLAALLVRVLHPPAGTIFVDGIDVLRLNAAHLRRHVAYVPQEASVFSGTIAENVAFGLPDAADASRVQAALNEAALSGDLHGLADGAETLVGERGATLSGGQRQRLALARALACEPRILIVDGCLSAVDAETERHILRGLMAPSAPRTTILLTDRVSVARAADMIVVLRDGRIVEQGRHDELAARHGTYAFASRRAALASELGTAE